MIKKNMEEFQTKFSGVWFVAHQVYEDERGSTVEILNMPSFNLNISEFEVSQILESQNRKGVVRGIHYSDPLNPQTKIVRCVSGHIRDCVVDLRPGSATFGQHEFFDLSSNSNKTLVISSGFGHGFEVVTETATVLYAIQTNFNFDLEYRINPLDPDLALPWHHSSPILSANDANASTFAFASSKILGKTRF